MSRVLFLQTWRSQGLKMLIVFVALTIWGSLLPIVYGAFGKTFQDIIQSGADPAAAHAVRRRRHLLAVGVDLPRRDPPDLARS